ncbi:unnamed protein product [Dracunculus medinensis]|uniref:Uncharacterized protein n=1 Tax=Dracunculus medinensis TaxID=318479 RepID=A0A0N4U999_DRAME|nr:unnamed protein product [Dracunculus medinensis]
MDFAVEIMKSSAFGSAGEQTAIQQHECAGLILPENKSNLAMTSTQTETLHEVKFRPFKLFLVLKLN